MYVQLGTQTLGSLEEASAREWLVTDGLGGYASGTVGGLATRRYHGLLMVAVDPPRGRMLGLVALDPVVVVGEARIPLATHEWASGVVAPTGHRLLTSFHLMRGVPTWRWTIGDVVVEREIAMVRGRPAVGIVHRLVRAPAAVKLELDALCTWRDAHGERTAWGEPAVEAVAGGFVFEGSFRVHGPGFTPGGVWYRGWRHREEAARGLSAVEDVWSAGRFQAELEPGSPAGVVAWAGDLGSLPPAADEIIESARQRFETIGRRAGAHDDTDRVLAHAADQFLVAGPTVVAGYPWFGDWSRDTMTSYEGLFLATGRSDEGEVLLRRAAASVSQGMLANTADAGGTEYNTIDATLWFLHALRRHVEWTGDLGLAADLFEFVTDIVDWHERGTRFGIHLDGDGLICGGADGWALTWMDARVDGTPVTGRRGKPVEVNALWLSALTGLSSIADRVGADSAKLDKIRKAGQASFRRRFVGPRGLFDVVDGPDGDDHSVRPNQLLSVSLPDSPLLPDERHAVMRAVRPLVTSIGLRSLHAGDPGYRGRHRGTSSERDSAYHQGTVWPWLLGPYVEASLNLGYRIPAALEGLELHLGEWGLGSVSETADGDPPHAATGCPFQAWSVAELIRSRGLLSASLPDVRSHDVLQVSIER